MCAARLVFIDVSTDMWVVGGAGVGWAGVKRCRDGNVCEPYACHPVLVWVVFRKSPSLHWCTFLEMFFL